MVGVYIFLTIVVILQILLVVIHLVSGSLLLNLANQLRDITIGLSAILDRTRPTDAQRSTSVIDAGLIDVTTSQSTYDPRFESNEVTE